MPWAGASNIRGSWAEVTSRLEPLGAVRHPPTFIPAPGSIPSGGRGAVTGCYASASHFSQPVEPPMSDHRLSLIGPNVPFLRTGLSPAHGVQATD
ncbi:MAG: hypothetical protein ACYC26_17195, partial [Phycisphaerales bacterium]